MTNKLAGADQPSNRDHLRWKANTVAMKQSKYYEYYVDDSNRRLIHYCFQYFRLTLWNIGKFDGAWKTGASNINASVFAYRSWEHETRSW
jgi:hypothetical protein